MGNAGRCTEVKLPAKTRGAKKVFDQTSFWHDKMCENRASQVLFEAAVSGDAQRGMTALIAHGNPNTCNAEGATPLMMAAMGGHLEVARLLVTSGAKVNITPQAHGMTPLSLASSLGFMEVVNLLLGWRADLSVGRLTKVPLNRGASAAEPLSRAAAAGKLEVCGLLLQHQADIDAQDERGFTATMRAVSHGYVEVTQLLVQAKASLALADNASCSALTRAVDLLIGSEPKLPGKEKMNSGVINGMTNYDYWTEMVHIMVEAGADPDIVDARGDTLICRAVRSRRPDVVRTLLRVGAQADIPVASLKGGTPLQLAAQLGANDICELLVGAKSEVNHVSETGMSPLHAAVAGGNAALCKLLLAQGAKFDLCDPKRTQSSLLQFAARGLCDVYDQQFQQFPYARPAAVGAEALAEADTSSGGEEDAEYHYTRDESDQD